MIAAPGCGLLRRLGRGDGLLEVLEAELQLVGVELLRAPAEPAALQPPDQQPQLLDLGSSRLALGSGSIALGFEGSDPGTLRGDDFHRLL